ncbi:hypothetical protein Y590_12805 [Methylobacterium sp. AMS5]|nr:hypothetical protein Y590_12805 [Methylobacterium sp. AMS5]
MKTKLILGSNGFNSGTPSELDYVADLFQDPRI